MLKKIIASTLLFAGLFTSSVSASASELPYFLFFNTNNDASRPLDLSRHTDLFRRFLHQSGTSFLNFTTAPFRFLPPNLQKLIHTYYSSVDQRLYELEEFFTCNYTFSIRDENGDHTYVLKDELQLVTIAKKLCALLELAQQPAKLMVSIFKYPEMPVPPEELEQMFCICEQIESQAQSLMAELQKISHNKPSFKDISSGRCIDTGLIG